MKYDMILAGVGGQGVLSVSVIIASSAMKEGLTVKQAEVHGMSQRGGAVSSNLRLSDQAIASDLIPLGHASMILSMEPMESLRYVQYLSRDSILITATKPVVNITNYPDMDKVLAKIDALPNSIQIDADKLAKQAGSPRATNMVLSGAASHYLPLKIETMENSIRELFGRKGEKVVEINLKAFRLGREVGAPK
ncbi:MAG: indolepyruvate oxidoreductase [Candidatus Cloacimonetes bacterium 4572_55]|nr:MAG: indolepyruvate oxidoreductase [Candidatus Cloacimonetes bacterium 4572_55]